MAWSGPSHLTERSRNDCIGLHDGHGIADQDRSDHRVRRDGRRARRRAQREGRRERQEGRRRVAELLREGRAVAGRFVREGRRRDEGRVAGDRGHGPGRLHA